MVAALARTADDSTVLRLATMTVANLPESGSARTIPLGSLTPSAVGFAGNGDLIVAIGHPIEPGAILVRLRRIPASSAP